jgi:hypothetical protein
MPTPYTPYTLLSPKFLFRALSRSLALLCIALALCLCPPSRSRSLALASSLWLSLSKVPVETVVSIDDNRAQDMIKVSENAQQFPL